MMPFLRNVARHCLWLWVRALSTAEAGCRKRDVYYDHALAEAHPTPTRLRSMLFAIFTYLRSLLGALILDKQPRTNGAPCDMLRFGDMHGSYCTICLPKTLIHDYT